MNLPINKNGIINEKALFQNLYRLPPKNKIDPVLSPNTQTTILYNSSKQYSVLQETIESSLAQIQKYDNIAYYIILLMYNNGLRISEVLNITYYDILTQGRFKIKGLKKSNDRIILDSLVSNYFINCKKRYQNPFHGYDRFYIYRILKKFGISIQTSNSKKRSVTHSFRHLFIHNLRKDNIDSELIKNTIGHKNIKNTNNYGK